MPLFNSSGPFSKKTPRDISGRELTNPALFGIASRLPKDDIIDPILTQEQVDKGDLHNLYISPTVSFRNVPFDLGWRTYQDLAEHANMHVKNNTFGTGQEGYDKLLMHQDLMVDGMLSGMSFLEAHKYALKVGPAPIHQSDHK